MDRGPTEIDPLSGPPGIVSPSIRETSSTNPAGVSGSPPGMQGSMGSLNVNQQLSQASGPAQGPPVLLSATASQTPQTSTPTNVNGMARPLVKPAGQTLSAHPPMPRDVTNNPTTPIVASTELSTATQSLPSDGSLQPNSNLQPTPALSQRESRVKQQSARRCAINFLKIYYRTLSANSRDLLRYYDLNACVDRISCAEFQNDDITGMSLQSVRNILRNFGSVLRVTIKLIDYQYSRDDNVLICVHGTMQFNDPINPRSLNNDSDSKASRIENVTVPPGTDVGFLQTFYLARNAKGWWVIQNDIFRLMNEGDGRLPHQPTFATAPQPMDNVLNLGTHSPSNESSRLNGGSSPLQNSTHLSSVGPGRAPMMAPTHQSNSTQTVNHQQTMLGGDFPSNDGQYRRPMNAAMHGSARSGARGGDRGRPRRMPRVAMEHGGRRAMNEMPSGARGHSGSSPHSGSGTPVNQSRRRGSNPSMQFPFSGSAGGGGNAGSMSHHNPRSQGAHQRPVSSHGYQRQNNGQFDNVSEFRGRPRTGPQYFPGSNRGSGRHSSRSSPENGIFIKLDISDVSENDIQEGCREFGVIESIQIHPDRKYAFVFFKSQDGMMRAVHEAKCMLRGVKHSIEKKRPPSYRFSNNGGDPAPGAAGASSRRGQRAARGNNHENSSRPASKSRSSRGDKPQRDGRDQQGRERDASSRQGRDSRDRERRDSRADQGRSRQGKQQGPRSLTGTHPNSSSSTSNSSPKKSGGKGKKGKQLVQSSQTHTRDRERVSSNASKYQDHADHPRASSSGDDGVNNGQAQNENVNTENVAGVLAEDGSSHLKSAADRDRKVLA